MPCGERVLPEAKCLLVCRQRPCSTQLTGTLIFDLAGTRIDVFRMRFCLAPRSSSPSRKRTRQSPVFSTRSSGTEPPSLTSWTATVEAAMASSASWYSAGCCGVGVEREDGQASCRRAVGRPEVAAVETTWTCPPRRSDALKEDIEDVGRVQGATDFQAVEGLPRLTGRLCKLRANLHQINSLSGFEGGFIGADATQRPPSKRNRPQKSSV